MLIACQYALLFQKQSMRDPLHNLFNMVHNKKHQLGLFYSLRNDRQSQEISTAPQD